MTGPLVASQIAAAKAEESENRYDDRYETRQSTTRVQAAETVRGAMTVAVVLGVSACLALEVRFFLFLHMRNWYNGVFFNTARRRKRAAVVGRRRLSLVDSQRLFDLWVEHYSRIPDESRRLLPIKPVYFLDLTEDPSA